MATPVDKVNYDAREYGNIAKQQAIQAFNTARKYVRENPAQVRNHVAVTGGAFFAYFYPWTTLALAVGTYTLRNCCRPQYDTLAGKVQTLWNRLGSNSTSSSSATPITNAATTDDTAKNK